MKDMLLVVFALLCGFTYGGLKGYSIGYDDAVENYTMLYEKIIGIQKETIEELKKELTYEEEGKQQPFD
jgi:hypothetical protein